MISVYEVSMSSQGSTTVWEVPGGLMFRTTYCSWQPGGGCALQFVPATQEEIDRFLLQCRRPA